MSNLTKGKISTTLLKFAFPFLCTSFLQAFYGAADLFVVGQFTDSAAVSAVAIGSQVMQTITGIILGISMGGTVLIGRRIGEKNDEGIANAIGSLSILFAIVAIILTPLMILEADLAISLMHTPAEAVGYTKQYILICALGIPFIIGYNAISGIFRGMGNSKTPVYFVLIACIINVVVDIVLVGVFKLGAAGAAIATISSQSISFIIALFYIIYKGLKFKINKNYFKLHKESAKYILMVGLPLALQDALVNVSFLIITAVINKMGVTASAAVGVVEKIIVFAMLPPSAFGSAVSAMTAQNIGAGKLQRANKILSYGIIYSLVFGILATTYCQICPETLTIIFSNDPEVIKVAGQYLMAFSIDCIMVSFVFCMNGYFSGCGKSVVSLVHSLIATFGFRIPMTYLISKMAGVTLYKLGLAAPISSLVSIVICFGYLFWQKRNNNKKLISETSYKEAEIS
ncbi:putative MATE family efflux protein [Clostridium tetanomorphum]|uniref:Probable multidrug resistance protein NorM n=1 Tax=Clostridium tetanomorphum TaxID=1553 RepID=A0A923EDJ7_CLOTT|nr:MATE family efflux transporter [Clostridium tetanomorphum]KAJ52487.1 Na+-driven multidrug efflux pump [Clostridium tetanomorphum DSM 665]MBC2399481.1 MATE family efflux transporter [Clostridium tetanomorphum]MBP1864166.1 putative MATE family efflux protein [Clostridium tetanomorphum]NRS84579.1 putative MATE family efflux protein [Clostridium tetanomorphum]NRZ97793.1 putative MATE family efflux protein [Clostridium tetanomorphum]